MHVREVETICQGEAEQAIHQMRMHEQREHMVAEARSSELENSLERDMMSQIRDLNN